jgi:hypothetical protein
MIPLLIAATRGDLAARALPDDRSSDGRTLRVLEISGAGLDPVRLYVDDQMMVVKQSFVTTGPDGRPERAEEAFSDYRPVAGVRVPFQAAVSRDGHVLVRRTLTRVTFNEPIDIRIFDKPQ